MKFLGFTLGVLLMIGAAACLIAEVLRFLTDVGYQTITPGEIWYAVHGNSLVGFQSFVENTISYTVWDHIQTILTWPGWLVLGVPGFLLIFSCRPRNRGLELY